MTSTGAAANMTKSMIGAAASMKEKEHDSKVTLRILIGVLVDPTIFSCLGITKIIITRL